MGSSDQYFDQITEVIQANGWEKQLTIELLQPSHGVRVRLGKTHPIAPSEIVNDYQEGIHPLEQVQQECLRALRTGSPGI